MLMVGRVPHRVLHVPGGVPRVLRRARTARGARRAAGRPRRGPTRTTRRRRSSSRAALDPRGFSPWSSVHRLPALAPGGCESDGRRAGSRRARWAWRWAAFCSRGSRDQHRAIGPEKPGRGCSARSARGRPRGAFWLDDSVRAALSAGLLGRPPSRRLGRPLHRGRRPQRAQRVDPTAGDRLRRIQTGQAQDYVYGVALGVLVLMVWMRWPR